jgi:acetyltransferase-like isoleucine patch superfamily enzyme
LKGLILLIYYGLPFIVVRPLYGLSIGNRLVIYGNKYIINEDVRIVDGDLVIINNVLENLP